MSLNSIFAIIAAVLFFLGAIHVAVPNVDEMFWGLFFLALSMIPMDFFHRPVA